MGGARVLLHLSDANEPVEHEHDRTLEPLKVASQRFDMQLQIENLALCVQVAFCPGYFDPIACSTSWKSCWQTIRRPW
jgi:hypothetical protein